MRIGGGFWGKQERGSSVRRDPRWEGPPTWHAGWMFGCLVAALALSVNPAIQIATCTSSYWNVYL